jgi:hypothetical protein
MQQGIVMDPKIAQEMASTDDVYQPLVSSVLFMSLWPGLVDGWWNSEIKPEAKSWFSNDRLPGGRLYRVFKDIPTDPTMFSFFRESSRNAYCTSFLYMSMMLREGTLSSFILKLLIDQLLDDADRTEKAFTEGRCNGSVWFWAVMITLAAVASAPAEGKLEAMQIITWQRAISGKIRLANTILGINDWKSAKAHLKLIAWQEGFDGEDEIRRMWEDIAWEDSKPVAGQDQTVVVFRNKPDYRNQSGLPTPEDTVTPGSTVLEE